MVHIQHEPLRTRQCSSGGELQNRRTIVNRSRITLSVLHYVFQKYKPSSNSYRHLPRNATSRNPNHPRRTRSPKSPWRHGRPILAQHQDRRPSSNRHRTRHIRHFNERRMANPLRLDSRHPIHLHMARLDNTRVPTMAAPPRPTGRSTASVKTIPIEKHPGA